MWFSLEVSERLTIRKCLGHHDKYVGRPICLKCLKHHEK